MAEYDTRKKNALSDPLSSITSQPKKKNGCLTLGLSIFKLISLYYVGLLILTACQSTYSILVDGARQQQWIKSNKEFARAASTACREREDKMIADRYASEVQNQELVLQPYVFDSIRFTEKNRYDFSLMENNRFSFYPDKKQKASANESSHVLRWKRSFKYIGKNPPLIFDPNYDIQITCFVSSNPIRASAIASEYLGQ